MKQKSWVPIYLALGLVWGCSFIFIKLGLEFLTPVGVAFGRCALGAMTLLLIVKVRGISLPTELRTWFFILFVFRSEKISKHQIFGLVIGGFGVVTVLGIWKGIGSNSAVGAIALLVAITCYGLSFPIIKKYLSPLNLKAEALAASQVSAAAVTLLPFYLIDGIAKNEYRTGPILAMIALGVFGSGLAYIWNFQIVERAGSSIASSVTYLTPLVAVLVGWIFLGEHISWHEPVGGLIILLGAATSQGRFNKKSTA